MPSGSQTSSIENFNTLLSQCIIDIVDSPEKGSPSTPVTPQEDATQQPATLHVTLHPKAARGPSAACHSLATPPGTQGSPPQFHVHSCHDWHTRELQVVPPKVIVNPPECTGATEAIDNEKENGIAPALLTDQDDPWWWDADETQFPDTQEWPIGCRETVDEEWMKAYGF